MSNKYEPMAGDTIGATCEQIQSMFRCGGGAPVSCVFNEIELTADETTSAESLEQFYWDESKRRSDAYWASPEGQARQREIDEQQKIADEARAEGIKEFDCIDTKLWQSWVEANQDEYGSGVVRYASRWAAMMDAAIAHGDQLKDVADKLSHEADLEGITGFMFGCARSMLVQCWQHGKELETILKPDTVSGSNLTEND